MVPTSVVMTEAVPESIVESSDRGVLPPGPSPLSALTNAVRFMTNPFAFLQSLTARYGGLVRFHLGPVPYCLVNRPDWIHEVLVDRTGRWTKGAGLAHAGRWIMGNGLLSSEGAIHQRQRRLCQPAFDSQHLTRYGDVMVRLAVEQADRWRDSEVVDLYDTMSELSLAVAAQTLFGFDDPDRLAEFHATYAELTRGFSLWQLMLSVLLFKLGLRRHVVFRRSERTRDRLDAIIYGVIDAKQSAADPGDDLLAQLIQATDSAGDGARMERQQLRDEAMTFLLAGHDTIAATLTWTWILLAEHPEVESRLHAELDAFAATARFSATDLPRLPYTTRVLQEVMRLYPAIWTMGRSSAVEMTIGGYRVPAGTQVMISPWVTHRDPAYFPEPEAFRPERWSDHSSSSVFLPFGGGRRMCIGRNYALMEGTLVLATLARQWRVRKIDSDRVDIRRGVVLKPRRPVRVRLERRPT
jgi:cytochrome P450